MKAKEFAKQVNRKEDVATIIKAGVSHVHIKNADSMTPAQVKEAYSKVLENHVLDKELLEILTQESNIQKIKSRFEHRITVSTKDQKKIGTFTIMGTKTTNEVLQDFRKSKSVNKNKPIKDSYKEAFDEMRSKGYTYSHEENGIYNQLDLDIIFRKG